MHEVAVSDDGSLLVAITLESNLLRFIEYENFRTISAFRLASKPFAVCFVPGSSNVLVQTTFDIQEFNPSGKVRHVQTVALLDFCSAGIACDGHRFVCTGVGSLYVYDYASAAYLEGRESVHGTRGPAFLDGELYTCNLWRRCVYSKRKVILSVQNPSAILRISSDTRIVYSRSGEFLVYDADWNVSEGGHAGITGPMFVHDGNLYSKDFNPVIWWGSKRRCFVKCLM